jgi:hypothetical protein
MDAPQSRVEGQPYERVGSVRLEADRFVRLKPDTTDEEALYC